MPRTPRKIRRGELTAPAPRRRREVAEEAPMAESGSRFGKKEGIPENSRGQSKYAGGMQEICPDREGQREGSEAKPAIFSNPNGKVEWKNTLREEAGIIKEGGGYIQSRGLAGDSQPTEQSVLPLQTPIYPEETTDNRPHNTTKQKGQTRQDQHSGSVPTLQFKQAQQDNDASITWRPVCKCGEATTTPPVVLDPFCGTGTTLAVAKSLGRRAIGLDISEEYCRLSQKRVKVVSLPLMT